MLHLCLLFYFLTYPLLEPKRKEGGDGRRHIHVYVYEGPSEVLEMGIVRTGKNLTIFFNPHVWVYR